MIAPDSTPGRRIDRAGLMRQTIDRVLGQPLAALTLFLASLVCGWHGFDLALSAAIHRPAEIPFTVNLRTTQYLFNYQDLGFVKRGLLGTLLHPFPALTTRLGLAWVCWFLLVLFAILFWRLFIASTEAVAENGRGVLTLLCATMPSFFLRLGYDFGRFDVVDLIAAVLSFAALARSRWFLASIPAGLAILVHEDFILFELPLVAALAGSALAQRAERRRGWPWANFWHFRRRRPWRWRFGAVRGWASTNWRIILQGTRLISRRFPAERSI